MFTSAGLIDVHERTHRSLCGLLDHCAGFSDKELGQEIGGFGYPSLRLQLHHMIGSEQYWIGVLQGELLVEENEADRASLAALRDFRARVAARTRGYLRAAPDDELNRVREVTTWQGKRVALAPAHALLRTQTHIFQHQGQVAAMARLLGRPVPPGLDFPLT